MTQQKLLKFLLLAFLTVFISFILTGFAGCRSIKHLTKTIDQSFAKKDSAVKANTVTVTSDSSKFNTEITVEYSEDSFRNKLIDGADVLWDQHFDNSPADYVLCNHQAFTVNPVPVIHTTQPIKRITIKTNVDLHKKDSTVTNTDSKVRSVQQQNKKDVVREKKVFPWYYSVIVIFLILLVIYYLYRKYKPKVTTLISKLF